MKSRWSSSGEQYRSEILFVIHWWNLKEKTIFMNFKTKADVEANVARIDAFCSLVRRPDLISLKSVQMRGWQRSSSESPHVRPFMMFPSVKCFPRR